MQPTDDTDKLLAETPVPSMQDGPHRAALKQELLARMQTMEKSMAEQPQPSGPGPTLAMPTKPPRHVVRPQWIAAAVAAAAVVVATFIFVVKQSADRMAITPPKPTEVAEASSSKEIEAESLVIQPRPVTRESL